jgi:hypothetical protein
MKIHDNPKWLAVSYFGIYQERKMIQVSKKEE